LLEYQGLRGGAWPRAAAASLGSNVEIWLRSSAQPNLKLCGIHLRLRGTIQTYLDFCGQLLLLMATELKRIAATVDETVALLASIQADQQDFQRIPLSESSAADLHSRTNQQLCKLLDLIESVEKLRKKASEPDPDKRLLGPKAAAAALQQCQQFDHAKEQLQKLIEFTSPVVDIIRQKQAEEAAAAEMERDRALECERQAAIARAAADLKATDEAIAAAASAKAAAEAEAFEKAEKLRLYRETRSNVKEVFAKAAETGVLNQDTVRAVMDGKEKHDLSKAWTSLPLGSGFVDIDLALRMEDMCSKMKVQLAPALQRFTMALAREGFTVLHEALRTVVMCPPLLVCICFVPVFSTFVRGSMRQRRFITLFLL
jgi:hypothetical protein